MCYADRIGNDDKITPIDQRNGRRKRRELLCENAGIVLKCCENGALLEGAGGAGSFAKRRETVLQGVLRDRRDVQRSDVVDDIEHWSTVWT